MIEKNKKGNFARKSIIIVGILLVFSQLSLNAQSNVNDEFIKSVKDNNIEITKKCIKNGADKNCLGENGWTALHYASHQGNYEMARYLLSLKPEINIQNFRGSTPLIMAVSNYHFNVCELLLDNGADINIQRPDGMSALLFACSRGWDEDINTKIFNGPKMDDDDLNFVLRKSIDNQTRMIKLLLERGANPNAVTENSFSAIHFIDKANISSIKALYLYGANLNIKDNKGYTALDYLNQYFAQNKTAFIEERIMETQAFLKNPNINIFELFDLELIPLLKEKVSKDQSLNMVTNEIGQNLLHRAVLYGNEDLVRLFINKGLDINSRDYYGRTPLLQSVLINNNKVANILIESDADVNITDNSGESPLSIALRRNEKNLAALLIKKGAKQTSNKPFTQLLLPIGHSSGITAIAISHSSKYLFTGSSDNKIICWDIEFGKPVRTYKGHSNQINVIVISPNDQFMISGSNDQTAIMWDVFSGEKIRIFKTGYRGVNSVVFSKDGKTLLIGSYDGDLQIVNVETGRQERNILGEKIPFCSSILSSDNKYILTSNIDTTVTLWNYVTGDIVKTYSGFKAPIYSLCFLSGETSFAASSLDDNIIVVRDIQTGNELKRISCLEKIMQVKCSEDEMYLGASSYTGVEIFDAKSYYKINSLPGGLITFPSEKGKIIICNKKPAIYDIHSGMMTSELYAQNLVVSKAMFLQNNDFFIEAVYGGKLCIWDYKNCKIQKMLNGEQSSIVSMALSSDGNELLTGSMDNNIKLWDIASGEILRQYPKQDYPITSLCFSPDNTTFLSGDLNNSLKLWDKTKGTGVKKFFGHTSPIFSLSFISNSNILSSSWDCTTRLWDINSGNQIRVYKTDSISVVDKWLYAQLGSSILSPDKKYFASNIDYNSWNNLNTEYGIRKPEIDIIDLYTGQTYRRLIGHEKTVTAINFSNAENKLVSGSDDKTVILWDIMNSSPIKVLKGHLDGITSVSFSNNDSIILSSSTDNTVKLWNANKGAEIATFIAGENENWICISPDNYYFASKGFAKQLAFCTGYLNVFAFDQFDLQFNRPDIILKSLGCSDSTLIRAYHVAYLKRIKKMRFNESMFSTDYHVPEITMVNADSLPLRTNNNKLSIQVHASDQKYYLDRINVWVNECPIYGIGGFDLRALKTKAITKTFNINLSEGKNNITISCFNEKGVESYKKSKWIICQPEKPIISKKYIVSISVSNYQDSRFNLKYAVEDGHDMAKMFADSGFIVDTLFNQNATRENILAIKQKLMQTKVDDEVILYVSGHGLLDKNYDFYFATYDMNFKNPAERGILYDDLEGLLDGIPARKKLLLMDACHSGEVDKDDIRISDSLLADNEAQGDLKVYKKGTDLEGEEGSGLGLQNSFELMQELFANLSRGSGAVVISAASGVGYALESAEWNNGVFTYCILNGLKNEDGKIPADSNKDGQVSVSELKDYVSAEVERLTNGAQKPTSRRESLEFDWRVW